MNLLIQIGYGESFESPVVVKNGQDFISGGYRPYQPIFIIFPLPCVALTLSLTS